MIATDAKAQAALPAGTTRAQVKDTLRQSSGKGGRDFSYLLKVADGESRFQANAKSRNSSAAGVFQFTEQTWLQMVKTHGAKYGLGPQAAAIKPGSSGRLEVTDAATRQAILARRHEPRLATQMATELAADNRRFLEKRLGRVASEGEVYAAHAFGPSGALRMIQARAAQPSQPGDKLLPAAAKANTAIFYDRATRQPRSVEQILARLDAVVADRLADASQAGSGQAAPGQAGLMSDRTRATLLAMAAM